MAPKFNLNPNSNRDNSNTNGTNAQTTQNTQTTTQNAQTTNTQTTNTQTTNAQTTNAQTTNAQGTNPSLSPHPKYYIRGADLHFLLGHTLFRVHSHFFLRESAFWQNELLGPSPAPDAPLKTGNSDTNAVVLTESPKDFEKLLWVFYNPLYDLYADTAVTDWVIIMRYASKWDFPQVKELAIRCLQQKDMNPINRIKLYQAFQVPSKYLFPLYVQLASRPELIGPEESRDLGLETLVLIYQARELLRAPPAEGSRRISPIRTDLKPADIFDIVATAFSISLTEVDLPATTGPGTGGTQQTAGGGRKK